MNRETLREPFSIQAFIACPFVVALALALAQAAAASPMQAGPFTAPAIGALAVVWYLWARMRAFVALNGGSALCALGSVVVSFLLATIGVVGLFAAVIL